MNLIVSKRDVVLINGVPVVHKQHDRMTKSGGDAPLLELNLAVIRTSLCGDELL